MAVTGLGKMGIAHAALLNMMEGADLIGLVDSKIKLWRYAKSLGFAAPFYPSLEELFQQQKPDAIFVCTPPSTHLPIARVCAEQDIHTLIEKPLAESLESAKTILSLVSRKSIAHAIGYNLAFVPIFRHVKKLLDDGVIGMVSSFSAESYMTKVMAPNQADKGWQFDPAVSGGGALANVGSHLVFLLYWYFGDLRSVKAKTEEIYSSRVEDSLKANLEFESGVSGDFITSWSRVGYLHPYTKLHILGSKGTLVVDEESIMITHITSSSSPTNIHVSDLENGDYFSLGGQGYYAQDADFLSRAAREDLPLVSWKEGVKVQAMMDAMYCSAQTDSVVLIAG